MKFDKQPKTADEQIDLLIGRGMTIRDRRVAAHFLLHLNYYRLTGYWLPLEETHEPHKFKAGTTFEQVINLYIFDRQFRLLLLDAIERIEVSVRTQWAYHISHDGGPHAYLEASHSSSHRKLSKQTSMLAAEIERSQEAFIIHLRTKYTDPDMPPAWAACEVLSLGQLSRWYELLRPTSLRNKIAKSYALDQQVLESLLHHLTYIRNLCAHHSRVWNRELTIVPPPVRSKPKVLADSNDTVAGSSPRRIYNTCCFVAHLMNEVAPGHQWRESLYDLVDRHSIDTASMGFPANWKSRPLWKLGALSKLRLMIARCGRIASKATT